MHAPVDLMSAHARFMIVAIEYIWWSRAMNRVKYGLALALALWGTVQAQTPELAGMQSPEVASGFASKSGWTAQRHMVAAANPLAAEAGRAMLRDGGSAVDAAIATQMVLTLVEPQSSGIGGGAFLLHFDGKRMRAYDGRETAPANVTENLFRNPDGSPMGLYQGMIGGRSVGVPGVLRMLEAAHRQHGKLAWKRLFEPAIALAENGFALSPRLHTVVAADRFLRSDPQALAYFFDRDGTPWPVGHQLKNPELARTLRSIAAGGADAFYTGPLAQAMVAKVAAHPTNPGGLALADLAGYRHQQREPLCGDYKRWSVCGMPPPSSGAVAIAQILGMLGHTNIAQLVPRNGAPDPQAVHLYAEAARLAYADRAKYIADPDFVPLPTGGLSSLLDKEYLASRAATIGATSAGPRKAGMPPKLVLAWGGDTSPELAATSHLSVVDDQGNVVSMTTSIESAFGSRQMVAGFFLNNELTDFSFDAADADGPIANRVQPGKRPRSSMSPMMVFERDSGKLFMTLGAPGGSLIINYVAKALLGTLDWGLDLQQAFNLPNFGSRNGPTELEQGRASPALIDALKRRGHDVRLIEQPSGLHGIVRIERDGHPLWFGAADPRREGVAVGD
jgi:gamma-glutamyltranspeptidase/glutathione hydrolase